MKYVLFLLTPSFLKQFNVCHRKIVSNQFSFSFLKVAYRGDGNNLFQELKEPHTLLLGYL